MNKEIQNYNEDDFTEENYTKLLNIAKQNYKFIFYDEIGSYKKFILWRHDVDFSMHRALKLAYLENEKDVKSTFFIMLTSNFYNIFEKDVKNKIIKIITLGHDIALHFDPLPYKINNELELTRWLEYEKYTIEKLLNIKIKVFSFHNPTVGSIATNDSFEYASMINTYSKYFFDTIKYCSDSNGYWRHERLEDLIMQNQYEKLQILTHPVWWVKTSCKARDRVFLAARGRFDNQMKLYDKLLFENGRKNAK